MKRSFKRILVAVMAFAMIFSTIKLPSRAASLEGRATEARLVYANADWSAQYWGGAPEGGVVANNATVTGEGTYTVGLDFTGTATGSSLGIAFAAVQIENGLGLFPGAIITVDEVKVNGAAIAYGKGYSSSDDGKELRSNIFNEWVSELPADAKRADGDLTDATPTPVSAADFADVKTVEVTFTLSNCDAHAYIAFADPNWAVQYWGEATPQEGVTVTDAYVTGNGQYKVGLDFATPVDGTAFTGLMVDNFEVLAPGATLTIDSVEINGAAVEVGKFYTSSDDGVQTRVNLYNEWVSEVPADARRADGDLADATPTPVSKDLFAQVKSYYVTFTVAGATPTAYFMFADAAWANQYWGEATPAEGVKVSNAVITGEGEYTVSAEFPAIEGMAFAALGIDAGENLFPGWFYEIKSVKVNGAEVALGKYYTSSDDGIVTRVNLFNEWVTEAPEDARRADGDLEGATPQPVAKEAFAGATKVEVTFDAVWGAKPVPKAAVAEDIVVEYSGEYGAYLGCQTNNDLWIFRNAWDDATYGADAAPDIFSGLWSTTSEQHYAGEFVDAVIDGDGTYTVKLTGADFQNETTMSQLFVSTSIPYSSSIVFSDVSVKINGSTKYTVEEGYQSADSKKAGKFAGLSLQNIWDSNVTDLFPIQFPVTDIEVTFTLSGLGYASAGTSTPAVEPTAEPTTVATAAPTEAPTVAPTEAPAAETAGVSVWVWIAVAVVLVAAIAVAVVVSKKKETKKD